MKIFISYSSIDRDLVVQLTTELEHSEEHMIWYDQKITAGLEWWHEICPEIRQCDLFIAVISENYIKSQPCTVEGKYAAELNKPILPLMIDGLEISKTPQYIQKMQKIDYQINNLVIFQELVKALKKLPKPLPLPDPLPPEPAMPLSGLEHIEKELLAQTMNLETQTEVLRKLQNAYESADKQQAAITLLRKLHSRDDIIVNIYRKIDQLLEAFSTTGKDYVPERVKKMIRSAIAMAISNNQDWMVNSFTIKPIYSFERTYNPVNQVNVSTIINKSPHSSLIEELLIRQWDTTNLVISKTFIDDPNSDESFSNLIAEEIMVIAQYAGMIISASDIKKILKGTPQNVDDIPF